MYVCARFHTFRWRPTETGGRDDNSSPEYDRAHGSHPSTLCSSERRYADPSSSTPKGRRLGVHSCLPRQAEGEAFLHRVSAGETSASLISKSGRQEGDERGEDHSGF